MKTNEEKIEDLINRCSFDDLTVEEKELVLAVLGTEDQYHALRKICVLFQNSTQKSAVRPAPGILTLLKNRLSQSRREASVFSRIFQIRIPAYAAFLLMIVSSTLVAMLAMNTVGKKTASEMLNIKGDTVYLTRMDTVFRERIVVKYVHPPAATPVVVTASLTPDGKLGVSMKEKEELDNFLVSGVN
jgi:hypothetical protein